MLSSMPSIVASVMAFIGAALVFSVLGQIIGGFRAIPEAQNREKAQIYALVNIIPGCAFLLGIWAFCKAVKKPASINRSLAMVTLSTSVVTVILIPLNSLFSWAAGFLSLMFYLAWPVALWVLSKKEKGAIEPLRRAVRHFLVAMPLVVVALLIVFGIGWYEGVLGGGVSTLAAILLGATLSLPMTYISGKMQALAYDTALALS